MSPLPITASPRKVRPAIHRPLLSNPATIPVSLIEVGAAPAQSPGCVAEAPQVVHDRCKFGVGPGGMGPGQPLLQLWHRQPARCERRLQRVRDALAVGAGALAAR